MPARHSPDWHPTSQYIFMLPFRRNAMEKIIGRLNVVYVCVSDWTWAISWVCVCASSGVSAMEFEVGMQVLSSVIVSGFVLTDSFSKYRPPCLRCLGPVLADRHSRGTIRPGESMSYVARRVPGSTSPSYEYLIVCYSPGSNLGAMILFSGLCLFDFILLRHREV
jgi:hypothetical protein